jgi:mono/diheme cytochrome c family protein
MTFWKSLFLLSLTTLAAAPAWSQELTFKNHGQTVKTLSADEISKVADKEEITVWDPNATKEIKFKGYYVKKLLDTVYGDKWHSAELVLFTCTDGYQPAIPASRFLHYRSYLAFQRMDQDEFSLINQNEQGKKSELGPYYLVWDNKSHQEIKAGDGNQWPYKLKAVDLVNFNDQFPKVAPPDNSSAAAKRGFAVFQQRCLGCHSINGEGGIAAPELNYPVNITEYYDMTWLKKWILNPTSIRFRTGMPGLDPSVPLRDKVTDDILAYFKAMVHKKIKP